VTALLTADRASRGLRNARYYMAARPLLPDNPFVIFNNSTATAVLEYADDAAAPSGGAAPDPEFPVLPAINDSAAADAYTSRLRSLASEEHPVNVPRHVQEHMLVTLAVNVIVCSPNEHCQGPRWRRCMSQVFSVQIMSTWMTTSTSNPPHVYFGPGRDHLNTLGSQTCDFIVWGPK